MSADDIRVLSGSPDHEELAAVTAVLLALAAGSEGAVRAALERPGARWALSQAARLSAGSWLRTPRPTWRSFE